MSGPGFFVWIGKNQSPNFALLKKLLKQTVWPPRPSEISEIFVAPIGLPLLKYLSVFEYHVYPKEFKYMCAIEVDKGSSLIHKDANSAQKPSRLSDISCWLSNRLAIDVFAVATLLR